MTPDLIGLPHRSLFDDRLAHGIALAEARGSGCGSAPDPSAECLE